MYPTARRTPDNEFLKGEEGLATKLRARGGWLLGHLGSWLVGLLVKDFYFLCVLGSEEVVGMNRGAVCHIEE